MKDTQLSTVFRKAPLFWHALLSLRSLLPILLPVITSDATCLLFLVLVTTLRGTQAKKVGTRVALESRSLEPLNLQTSGQDSGPGLLTHQMVTRIPLLVVSGVMITLGVL